MPPYFLLCIQNYVVALAVAFLYAQGRISEAVLLFAAWA